MAGWASVSYYAISAATDRGLPQATTDIVSGTGKRDVSEILDLLALADTPFINRVGWGKESGGTKVEWISEDLGPGYVLAAADVASDASQFAVACLNALTTAEAIKQVYKGTVMYHHSSTDTEHALLAALTCSAGLVDFEFVTCPALSSYETSILANDKIWVLGAAAGEGSIPRKGKWRSRVVNTNEFIVLRQDVQITGSQKATDMYAIGKEDRHQILLRLKEMQRDRERMSLYSLGGSTRSTSEPGNMRGVAGFLMGQSGTNIDTSTRTLTETAVNTVVNEVWNYGGQNLAFFGNIDQCAKFTQWDKNRIRMAPRDNKGGGYVKYYMTESAIELEVVPMRQVPKNLAFILDTSKIRLRAKNGRKGIMEKLGKQGDFDDWQIISEFSLEMQGYNLMQHGMFTNLS